MDCDRGPKNPYSDARLRLYRTRVAARKQKPAMFCTSYIGQRMYEYPSLDLLETAHPSSPVHEDDFFPPLQFANSRLDGCNVDGRAALFEAEVMIYTRLRAGVHPDELFLIIRKRIAETVVTTHEEEYQVACLTVALDLLKNLDYNGMFAGIPAIEDCEPLVLLSTKRLEFEALMRCRFTDYSKVRARSLPPIWLYALASLPTLPPLVAKLVDVLHKEEWAKADEAHAKKKQLVLEAPREQIAYKFIDTRELGELQQPLVPERIPDGGLVDTTELDELQQPFVEVAQGELPVILMDTAEIDELQQPFVEIIAQEIPCGFIDTTELDELQQPFEECKETLVNNSASYDDELVPELFNRKTIKRPTVGDRISTETYSVVSANPQAQVAELPEPFSPPPVCNLFTLEGDDEVVFDLWDHQTSPLVLKAYRLGRANAGLYLKKERREYFMDRPPPSVSTLSNFQSPLGR